MCRGVQVDGCEGRKLAVHEEMYTCIFVVMFRFSTTVLMLDV